MIGRLTEAIQPVKELHAKFNLMGNDNFCTQCWAAWPCPVAQLVQAIEDYLEEQQAFAYEVEEHD